MFPELDTPAVLIDLPIVRRNIQTMIAGLSRHNIAHRPHFKAHKSIELAKMQLEAGAIGMTAAKLGEAEILVENGVCDIFIAYPIVGEIKLRRLLALAQKSTLRVLINSIEAARAMSDTFALAGLRIKVLIELEGGMERSGITLDTIADFAREIMALPGLELVGVMSYHGTVYALNGNSAFAQHARQEAADLRAAQKALADAGIFIKELSDGSSFSGKFPQELNGLTEVRAGNYIFNDVAQLSTGLVTEADCALSVLCTVVTLTGTNRAVIDAGSKTFSSDVTKFGKGYGYMMGCPGAVVYKLSEEHGYLELPEGMNVTVGQRLRIIPNHACTLPNLTDTMIGLDEDGIHEIRVNARGCNQ